MNKLLNKTKLFGYDDFFYQFDKMYKSKKLPKKILISGSKGIGKYTFCLHFINYILSKREVENYDHKNFELNIKNKSWLLMQNLTHPNFNLVQLNLNKKSIEIDQIRDLIIYSQKKSFNDSIRFVLIDNLENLTNNASNSLLKLLEEPPDNLFFFLIHDNAKKVLDTIKSRCITFKKNLTHKEVIDTVNHIIENDVKNLINPCFLNKYNTVADLIFLIELSKNYDIDIKNLNTKELLNNMIGKKIYKNNNDLIALICKLIQSFYFQEFYNTKNKKFYDAWKYFMRKINNAIIFNLDIETLFFEFKNKNING